MQSPHKTPILHSSQWIIKSTKFVTFKLPKVWIIAMTFRAIALRQSEWWRAMTRNVSFLFTLLAVHHLFNYKSCLHIKKSNLRWRATPNNYHFMTFSFARTILVINTNIYYKRHDSHQYLDFFSCHPKHTKFNIPFTLARRICTIVINENLREQHLYKNSQLLRGNNYPEGVITMESKKQKN